MSAVFSSPVPTELKARLFTWTALFAAVLLSSIMLWMSLLSSFAVANPVAELVLGTGADAVWQGLYVSFTGAACLILGAFAYACMVRGTLRER